MVTRDTLGNKLQLPDFGEKQLQESLQSYLVQGADEIRKRLKLTEGGFQFMSRAFNARGRKHFIYEVLNEIEQLAMALMRLDEALAELPRNQADDIGKRIYRNSLELTEREISLHSRRLIELLVHLINFSQVNSDAYYDHYLLYQELQQRKKKKHDERVYYGSENLNNAAVIEHIKRFIALGESKIDLTKCWYLQGSNPKPRGEALMETFDNCFKKALRVATVSEKIALGFSYNQSYGLPSQSIHLGIGRIKSGVSFEGLRMSTGILFNVGMLCLHRCRKLLGLRNRKGILPGYFKEHKNREKELRLLYETHVKPNVRNGDFVRVADSLFEVLGSASGSFGYRSFKLRHLTRPHIPEIEVEWYPAYNVEKVEDGRRMRDSIIKLLTIDGHKPIISPRIIRREMRNFDHEVVE